MEELGDSGWARERERMIHLQQLHQLHQVQFQHQQVGYGYGVGLPGQPQGPVMVASPGDQVPAPGCPMPVQGGMMMPVGGVVPPTAHVPTPWPVQWETQAQGNVYPQPGWEHDDRHEAAFNEKRRQGQDVYFHPGSEDGHLDLRISEWKGKHCFYQGPEDYSHQEYCNVLQEKCNKDFRNQEEDVELDEDIRRKDQVRENDRSSERYDRRSRRYVEDYNSKDKYRRRDHYDGKYNEHYESRHPQYKTRKHRKPELREHDSCDSYNSEYEDHDYKDTYARRNNYRDNGHYYDCDRDYHESRDSHRYREKEHYHRREDDRYYDVRKHKDHYYDRYSEERYDRRENHYKDREGYSQSNEETYTSKRRDQYDSEPERHCGYKERDYYYRYKDTGDDWREEDCDHRRKDHYKTREHYEWKPADQYEYDIQNRRDTRDGEHSHNKSRDRYQDLRSLSADSSYEEYPKKDRKTHCEEWVEQQNEKFALRQNSFEDPIIYRRNDEQEKGYESGAGSAGSKRHHKPVYVGSLDRNSYYRKTAPSSLQRFATTRKRNQGKLMGMS